MSQDSAENYIEMFETLNRLDWAHLRASAYFR